MCSIVDYDPPQATFFLLSCTPVSPRDHIICSRGLSPQYWSSLTRRWYHVDSHIDPVPSTYADNTRLSDPQIYVSVLLSDIALFKRSRAYSNLVPPDLKPRDLFLGQCLRRKTTLSLCCWLLNPAAPWRN